MTKGEHDKATPAEQGYMQYREGSEPGSELAGLTNPYDAGTEDHAEWNRGQAFAILGHKAALPRDRAWAIAILCAD